MRYANERQSYHTGRLFCVFSFNVLFCFEAYNIKAVIDPFG